ncbi:Pentatricopeptide repeat-containing protein At5g02830, chloroplastic [Linum perenne]
MREFVILGSSSIVTPPNHHHDGHRHRSPNPKHKPVTPSSSTSRHLFLSRIRRGLIFRPQRPALNYHADVAAKLAGDGRLRDFTMILESVDAFGVAPSDFAAALPLKPVGEGILLNLRDGNVEIVFEVLKEVEKLGISPEELFDQVNLELFLRECGRIVQCKELREVVEFLEDLDGFGFNIEDIVDPLKIVKLCVDQRNPDLVVRYASIRLDNILLCTIINEFGKSKDLDSALKAYEAFSELLISPNTYMCRTIIDVCGTCGDYMKSRLIFEDMLEQKITPNIYIFNSLMNVNAHDLAYIMYIYKKMQDVGVKAGTISYNIMLKCCCLAGRIDMAQNIYNKLRLLESTSRLKLDNVTYCTMIKVFADAQLWKMSLKVKDDMLASGVSPNMRTWSALISACANAGLVREAFHLFEEMLQSGCYPNTRCFNILLHACVKVCQYDRAFRLFQLWKQNGVQKSVGEIHSCETENISEPVPSERCCTSTAPVLVSSPLHVNFIKKFPFAPTKSTYCVLMKACGTNYDRAKALMVEMQQQGLDPDKRCWSILIHMCGASKNAELAVQTLKEMRMDGVEPDAIAYTTTIKVCVESSNLKLAFLVFAEMKRYGFKPDKVTYSTLLRARTQYGSLKEIQQCLAIYQEMRKAGYNANDYYLKQLIEEWCEGVIQHRHARQDHGSRQARTALAGSKHLVLEKVATHLQNGTSGNVSINLQGLTTVESRIVLLAVLRMTKEKYNLGYPVTDDISIIVGAEGAGSATSGSEQRAAILKLLQKDLGLEVLAPFPGSAVHVDSSTAQKEKVGSNNNLVLSYTRRPVVTKITISRDSLLSWVEKNSRSRN